MSPEAWELMWSYTDLIVGEVACFGYTELDVEHKEVYIPEVFLVPQQASAAEVDFMSEGLPFAIDKALAAGRIDDLRFCIHSHGEFGANWSQTDEDMIRKIGSTGTPWFASVIFNKKGATAGRIDVFGDTPFGRTQHTLKDLDVRQDRGYEYDTARIDELEMFVRPTPPPAKKEVKLLGQTATATAKPKGPTVVMLDDSTITINGVPIDLDDLGVDALAKLALQLDWQWADDAGGTRYYWDNTAEVFYEAKQYSRYTDTTAEDADIEYEVSEPVTDADAAAHAYTDAAI
jgi:hypothetical protein